MRGATCRNRSHAASGAERMAPVAARSAVHAPPLPGTTPQQSILSQQRRSRWQPCLQRRWRARGETWHYMNSTASRRVHAEQPLTERWSPTLACSRDTLASIRRMTRALLRNRQRRILVRQCTRGKSLHFAKYEKGHEVLHSPVLCPSLWEKAKHSPSE